MGDLIELDLLKRRKWRLTCGNFRSVSRHFRLGRKTGAREFEQYKENSSNSVSPIVEMDGPGS